MGKNADLSDLQRTQVMQRLLGSIIRGKLPRGKISETALLFNVCRKTVGRIWQTALAQKAAGEVISVPRKSIGRRRHFKHKIDYARIEQIDKRNRTSISALSNALGPDISRATVGRWAKLLLRVHTNAIKPLLTAENMLTRLSFCLQAIHYDFTVNKCKFKPMENTIHIDEKWFYLTRKSFRYYLTPMEADPLRVTQSKNFIPKVMFLCAVSRPVFDEDGTVKFDGKIGIWPFVGEKTAQRNSKKRPRGTKEIVPIQSITRQVIKDCIIKEVIPAIKQKWPAFLSKNIKIQQDNCRTHINNGDLDFQDAANSDGFQMKLVQQPANSPDCNANDLGFFTAIQSLQQRIRCKNADDIIAAVKESFNQLDSMTLNKVFLSLQCVLTEIMKLNGKNDYKQPHMKKDSLLRQGLLPQNLEVPDYLVRECVDHLIREENTAEIEILMEELGISVPQVGEGVLDLNM